MNSSTREIVNPNNGTIIHATTFASQLLDILNKFIISPKHDIAVGPKHWLITG